LISNFSKKNEISKEFKEKVGVVDLYKCGYKYLISPCMNFQDLLNSEDAKS